MAVGDSITGIDPHTDFGATRSDHFEGAFDSRRRLVVIDDAGGAPFQSFKGSEFGGPFDGVKV